MSISLVWFRNDLRTIDHLPLREAANAGPMIAFYCFDQQQFGTTRFGFAKTGTRRAQFLIECVTDLRLQLHRLGGDLVIRVGDPPKELKSLLNKIAIDTVHFHEAVGTEETTRSGEVIAICESLGVNAQCYEPSTLYHPDDLTFPIQSLPGVFTKFRKVVEKKSTVRSSVTEPTRIESPAGDSIEPGEIPTLDFLGCSAEPIDARQLIQYRGGQRAGLERVEGYFWQQDRLRVYKTTRNGMLSPNDSSKLSPWLAHGCLSARTIHEEVQRYEQNRVANDSTYWLVFELLWRDYFQFVARKHGADIFRVGGLRRMPIAWKQDWERFDLWKAGQTGYPLVDANMRELAVTGYMSNRGRQNVASFLTKNLGIDWRMGAEWFESRLIDYDVASNFGNWNYAAGVGNDARGFRFFNITKQSRDYDPKGEYLRHWLPELSVLPAAKVHEPWKLSNVEQRELNVQIGVDYPHPVVDLVQSASRNEQTYQDATAAVS